jgi:hypothetical protein
MLAQKPIFVKVRFLKYLNLFRNKQINLWSLA